MTDEEFIPSSCFVLPFVLCNVEGYLQDDNCRSNRQPELFSCFSGVTDQYLTGLCGLGIYFFGGQSPQELRSILNYVESIWDIAGGFKGLTIKPAVDFSDLSWIYKKLFSFEESNGWLNNDLCTPNESDIQKVYDKYEQLLAKERHKCGFSTIANEYIVEKYVCFRLFVLLCNYSYYCLHISFISDSQYDYLYAHVVQLEQTLKVSPAVCISNMVGFSSMAMKKVSHTVPMLSLSNIFSDEDVNRFFAGIQTKLRLSSIPEIIAEEKIDGISISLIYKNGKLSRGVTRGNGILGEDVTQNILLIDFIPKVLDIKQIKECCRCDNGIFEVRGEIFITHKDFQRLNTFKRDASKDSTEYQTLRNTASGIVNSKHQSKEYNRFLSCCVFSIPTNIKHKLSTDSDVLIFLQRLGFHVVPFQVISKISDVFSMFRRIEEQRSKLLYDVDGLVYKINNLGHRELLGTKSHSPRWAVAHKFVSVSGITRIVDIVVQVGRSGILTPVAELEPVQIGGSMITRATLHNEEYIAKKDIRVGDTVRVSKAGGVVPKVETVILECRSATSSPRRVPVDICPVCHTPVQLVNMSTITTSIANRICPAKFTCRTQIIRQIEHFVSREAFNIIGLGKQTIKILHKNKFIEKPSMLFTLAEHTNNGTLLIGIENFGDRLVKNLLNEIKIKSVIPLDRFIYSLGIPLVGIVVATALAQHYGEVNKWWSSMLCLQRENAGQVENDLLSLKNFGSAIIKGLRSFVSCGDNVSEVKKIMQRVTVLPFKKVIRSDLLNDKTVVISGKWKNRKQVEAMVVSCGGKNDRSVSRNTYLLAVGDKPSEGKVQKANRYNVPIMNEEEFIEFIKG